MKKIVLSMMTIAAIADLQLASGGACSGVYAK